MMFPVSPVEALCRAGVGNEERWNGGEGGGQLSYESGAAALQVGQGSTPRTSRGRGTFVLLTSPTHIFTYASAVASIPSWNTVFRSQLGVSDLVRSRDIGGAIVAVAEEGRRNTPRA